MARVPVIDLIPAGIATCDAKGRISYANAHLLDWLELDDDSTLIGQPFYSVLAPAGRIYFETHVRPMLLIEHRAEEISIEFCAASGERIPVLLTGRTELDAAGEVKALHLVSLRAAQRQSYERELLIKRRRAAAFEAIVRASPDAIISVDADQIITSWNDAATRLLGYTEEEAIGRTNVVLLVPDSLKEELRAHGGDIRSGLTVQFETERRHKDGTLIPIELSVAGFKNEDGEHAGAIGILRDIRKRKADEALIETLNREILHRSKNLLAVVQGVAKMTARNSDPETFLEDFSQRLNGLSNSLTLLVERNWGSVSLEKLVTQQLAHLAQDLSSRLTFDGPPVEIPPGMAEPIGMALFELSTNAVKYGALGAPDGRVTIAWDLAPAEESMQRLVLSWSESGVDATAAPRREGFGSALTGHLLEAATEGEVTADYANGGLQWRFCVTAEGFG